MSCTEERDELSQSLGQCRDKVHGLEKATCDTRNIISILEEDIRAGRREYDALKGSTLKLQAGKEQVLGSGPLSTPRSAVSFPQLMYVLPVKLLEQIRALEQTISQQSGEKEQLIGQLDRIQDDHTSASENTESMVGKIQVSGAEWYITSGRVLVTKGPGHRETQDMTWTLRVLPGLLEAVAAESEQILLP